MTVPRFSQPALGHRSAVGRDGERLRQFAHGDPAALDRERHAPVLERQSLVAEQGAAPALEHGHIRGVVLGECFEVIDGGDDLGRHALGLGPGRRRPAGVLALSGFIPRVEGWEIDPEGREGLPVLIAHGTLDPIIQVAFGRDARDRATAAGLDVEYHQTAVPHTIDPALVPAMREWLARAVPAG